MREKSFLFLFVVPLLIMGFGKDSYAISFGAFDPRSLAMGGAGVASSDSASAAYYNPALLAMFNRRKELGRNSQFIFPSVTARLANSVETVDDARQDNLDQQLIDAIDTFNANQNAQNAQGVLQASRELESDLDDLLDGPVHGDINAGMVLGIGHKHEGGSIIINRRFVGDGSIENFEDDLELLDIYVEAMQFIEAGGNPATAATLYPEIFDAGGTLQDNLTSTAIGGAILITEIGMAMAGQFNIARQEIAIGITPKIVHVETFDFFADATTDTTTDVSDDHEDWDVNLDVGIAHQYDAKWRAGFVVKNIRTLRYKTSLGNTIEVRPQARLGVMHKSRLSLYAADLDVIKNKPVRRGFDSQMLSLGGEWRVHRFFNLRAGASKNLAGVEDSKKILYTLGANANVFNRFIADLTYAESSYEWAFGLRLGIRF